MEFVTSFFLPYILIGVALASTIIVLARAEIDAFGRKWHLPSWEVCALIVVVAVAVWPLLIIYILAGLNDQS